MKTLQSLLVAGLVLGSSLVSLRAEISAQAWLETYYLDPQPAAIPHAIDQLSREGYFDRAENVAVAIGFFGTLFEQQPDRVDGWLQSAGKLPVRHQRLLVAALWQSGHPRSDELLRQFGQASPVRAEVERLAGIPSPQIIDVSVRSPSSLRLRWGAFLATGNERHLLAIFDAFRLNEPTLSIATRQALARNAAAHPRVMEICRAQLDRQSDEIRSELRDTLRQAELLGPLY